MVGNSPNFTRIDVLRCFLRLGKGIGRQGLARELELGEGTVRTILSILKKHNLLESTKQGHFLSRKGRAMLEQLLKRISLPRNVSVKSLHPKFRKVGVLLKSAPKLNTLYKLRDLAVKNGAEGALILAYNENLYAPGVEQDFDELKRYFDVKNGDAVVVAFSGSKRNAEAGALAIAAKLNSSLKRFMKTI